MTAVAQYLTMDSVYESVVSTWELLNFVVARVPLSAECTEDTQVAQQAIGHVLSIVETSLATQQSETDSGAHQHSMEEFEEVIETVVQLADDELSGFLVTQGLVNALEKYLQLCLGSSDVQARGFRTKRLREKLRGRMEFLKLRLDAPSSSSSS